MFNKEYLKLYFICGTQDIPKNKSIIDVVTEALESGITMFQFREKGEGSLTGNAKIELAQKLFSLCKSYSVPFIVNDDVDLANAIDADGIHVGQNDANVDVFASAFTDKIIGLSVSDLEEYQASDLSNVDYIGVGPMYHTGSKSDAKTPVGPEMIQTLRTKVQGFPIVAIGGIHTKNAEIIMKHGADGLSIISAIAKSSNIPETVQQFLQTVE
ncbi:thiamine phosphate synthase [Staphylococcus cohnii]|uniref:thiamine phosphate synthase n=1 Tax=Staphylococcus cohnii TaxID=29382 RepID=UPI00254C1FD3|nr:thiamine phosphate synthase [Staphylococcus cohnii]WIL70468.1 thiamine phosphate synthase [Staphylococcus cohnii]